jgi:hypothetical protein
VTIRPKRIEKIARSESPDHLQSACMRNRARRGQRMIQKLSQNRPAIYAEARTAAGCARGLGARPARMTSEREATVGF